MDGGDGPPGTLPGTGTQDRIVVHVDMDCFYAACERLRDPALDGEPVVVGMGFEPGETHGAVATASYERARRRKMRARTRLRSATPRGCPTYSVRPQSTPRRVAISSRMTAPHRV